MDGDGDGDRILGWCVRVVGLTPPLNVQVGKKRKKRMFAEEKVINKEKKLKREKKLKSEAKEKKKEEKSEDRAGFGWLLV